MGLLSRKVSALRLEKSLASERAAHGSFIAVVMEHAFFQNRSEQAGDADFVSSGFDAGPPGDIFLKGDGHVAQLCFITRC